MKIDIIILVPSWIQRDSRFYVGTVPPFFLIKILCKTLKLGGIPYDIQSILLESVIKKIDLCLRMK